MPCNARVLVKAVVEIGAADLSAFTKRGPNLYILRMGPVTVEISGDKAEIRSNALSWNEGVTQIKNTIKMLQGKGVIVKDAGRPETHLHDHPGPWQRQGVR